MPEAAVRRSHRAFGSISGRAHGASLALFLNGERYGLE